MNINIITEWEKHIFIKNVPRPLMPKAQAVEKWLRIVR